MGRLIRNTNRWIHALLTKNSTLEEEGVIDFEFKGKAFRFKLNLIVGEHRNWTIDLYEVVDGIESKIDGFMCNAGHKKCLSLMAELLIRRHCWK